jgi:hypothetical protein
MRTVDPEETVYTVKQICPYHGNLVDNNDIQPVVDFQLIGGAYPVHLIQGNIRFETAKRMDGLSPYVKSGYSGRSEYGYILAGIIPEIFQQCGFAGAGPAGYEDAFGPVLHQIQGSFELPVHLQVGGSAFGSGHINFPGYYYAMKPVH